MIKPKYRVDPRTYVYIDSIAYIESICPSTVLHLKDGRQVMSCRPIGYVHGQLSELIRVHRAFAVRRDEMDKALRTISRNGDKGWQLRLKSGKTIPVGRIYGEAIKTLLFSL